MDSTEVPKYSLGNPRTSPECLHEQPATAFTAGLIASQSSVVTILMASYHQTRLNSKDRILLIPLPFAVGPGRLPW